jgi:hypothetical protein
VKDARSKERRVVDVYRTGFAMLSEGSLGAMGDDDALLNQKFRRFDFYVHTPEVRQGTYSTTDTCACSQQA